MKIGIISDIHEDIISLKKALKYFETNNCNEIVCLGDITGFDKSYSGRIQSPNASECISAVKSNCKYAVIGNHDLYSIRKLPVIINGFKFPENWYLLDFDERKNLGEGKVWLYENEAPSSQLSREDSEFLNTLPEYISIKFEDYKILFSHSVYPDITGSLVFNPHNPWNLKEHFAFRKKLECDFSFSGHIHPNGFVRADMTHIKLLSYRSYKFRNKYYHYFCPCTANGSGKSGLLIIDFKEITITAVKLDSRNKIQKLYEWLRS